MSKLMFYIAMLDSRQCIHEYGQRNTYVSSCILLVRNGRHSHVRPYKCVFSNLWSHHAPPHLPLGSMAQMVSHHLDSDPGHRRTPLRDSYLCRLNPRSQSRERGHDNTVYFEPLWHPHAQYVTFPILVALCTRFDELIALT